MTFTRERNSERAKYDTILIEPHQSFVFKIPQFGLGHWFIIFWLGRINSSRTWSTGLPSLLSSTLNLSQCWRLHLRIPCSFRTAISKRFGNAFHCLSEFFCNQQHNSKSQVRRYAERRHWTKNYIYQLILIEREELRRQKILIYILK